MKPRLLRVKWLLAVLAVAALAVSSATLLGILLARRSGTSERAAVYRFFAEIPPVLNIAHRGASAAAPEHSLDAYRLAVAQGAHMLELDLRMTRDRVLVVVHDADLARLTGASVKVAESSLAELRTLAGARAPLPLSEVVAAFPGMRWNFELKENDPEAARALFAVISEHDLWDRAIVASFRDAVIRSFRELSKERVATAATGVEAFRFYVCYRTGIPCRVRYAVLQLPFKSRFDLTDPDFIRHAHGLGLAVHYWTVDDEATMKRLLDAGADGIMTNQPERLARILSSR